MAGSGLLSRSGNPRMGILTYQLHPDYRRRGTCKRNNGFRIGQKEAKPITARKKTHGGIHLPIIGLKDERGTSKFLNSGPGSFGGKRYYNREPDQNTKNPSKKHQ
jgi:hypothetical protein